MDDLSDLDDLIKLWKSGNIPNSKSFKSRIYAARIKMIVLIAIEAAIATTALVVGFYHVLQGSLILGASILVFSLVSFGIAFWSRSGAWRIPSGSVKDELQASIKQARAQYRWAWGGIWISALALIFMAILVYLNNVNYDQNYLETQPLLVGFSIALVFVAVNLMITSFILENSRRRIFKLRTLYKQLGDSRK